MKQSRKTAGLSPAGHSRKEPLVKNYRLLILMVSVMTVIALTAGTIAYLTKETAEVTNSFEAGSAPPVTIEESFDNKTKENVCISLSEEGEGSYFVRAAVIVSFKNDSGEVVAAEPVEGTDYTLTLGSDWSKRTEDGFYYYNKTVLPEGSTTALITECKTLSTEYHLNVEIVAQTLQSNPTDAAQAEWGFVPATE